MNALANVANVCQVLAVLVFPAIYYIVRKLNKEMHNNGGSTIKDAIDRIESEQKKQNKQIRRLARDLEAHLSDFE